jgi:hypothetical protein
MNIKFSFASDPGDAPSPGGFLTIPGMNTRALDLGKRRNKANNKRKLSGFVDDITGKAGFHKTPKHNNPFNIDDFL